MNQLTIGLAGAVLLAGLSFARVPIGFVQKQSTLAISASAPPAILQVVDPQGRRNGADFSLPTTSFGMQKPDEGFLGLDEIPYSASEQQNIGDVEADEPGKYTGWFVTLYDTGRTSDRKSVV